MLRSSSLRYSTQPLLLSTTRTCTSLLIIRSLSTTKHRSLSYNDISTKPDFSQYHPHIETITGHLSDLGPFPVHSPYLNQQHFYQNTVVKDWSRRTPHPVTLQHLAMYGKTLSEGKIIASANFVRLELPIRIALKLRELQNLPFSVVNNFHLAKVYESYYEIFERFRKIPEIKTIADNDRFCEMLEDVLTDVNLLNLPNLMMGALECCILQSLSNWELDDLISSLLRARISRRLIIEEHLSLTRNFMLDPKSGRSRQFIGDIFFKCSAEEHLQITASNATKFIESLYPGIQMPQLIIEGAKDLQFYFLTAHLHYMLGEILRNCYEATVKHFIESKSTTTTTTTTSNTTPPPVRVCLIDSKDYVGFRFSDRGGGIEDMEPIQKAWSFAKDPTLARRSLQNFHQLPHLDLEAMAVSKDSTMKARKTLMHTSVGGIDDNRMKEATLLNLTQRPAQYKLGLGLAMCKVYADYWNGDLVVHSLKGYGTDTYLKLGKLGYHKDKLQLDRA